MVRSLFIVGVILIAGLVFWVGRPVSGVNEGETGASPLADAPAAEDPLATSFGDLDPDAAPIKSVAAEQIARVTDLTPPPPRNVSPSGTTGWPTPAHDAGRVPGALPASPPPEPPEPDLFRLVAVEDAGTLRWGEKMIRLAHIETRERDAVCEDATGRTWPCGQAAVTELRMLIRGRAVACDGLKGPQALSRTQPRTCHIGNIDLAQWLIAQGWATPTSDAPPAYRDAHDQAKGEKRGNYGQAWGADSPPVRPIEVPEPSAIADAIADGLPADQDF